MCIGTCPAPYSGYYNGTANICVLNCPTDTYSYNRVCGSGCTFPYFADNATNYCVLDCLMSYASKDSQKCVSSCALFPIDNLADNSTNQCVNICPSTPDYYAQNNMCVLQCTVANTYADPTSGVRTCTTLCTSGLFSDTISRRCLSVCPNGYWGQNGTNKC